LTEQDLSLRIRRRSAGELKVAREDRVYRKGKRTSQYFLARNFRKRCVEAGKNSFGRLVRCASKGIKTEKGQPSF